MPYLGDSPTNPVPLTLVGGAAVGEASAPAENDRHICWFSIPAQAAGNSVLLETSIGGIAATEVDLVMLWEGSNTAYFVNTDRDGTRQMAAYRPLPAGVPALIGVVPKGALWPVQASLNGEAVVGPAQTLAQWGVAFPLDLTKRLKADTSLAVTVGATAPPLGSTANPFVVDFTSSSAPVVLTPPASPDIRINVTLAPNTALKLTDSGASGAPTLADPTAGGWEDGNAVYLKPAAGVTLAISMQADTARPVGDLTLEPIPVSVISGVGVDSDGSPEQTNVLLFRIQDAWRAVQGGAGGYALPNIPNGDYIAVAFSRTDARDVRATNVLVPPGERSVGGGYSFVPPPEG